MFPGWKITFFGVVPKKYCFILNNCDGYFSHDLAVIVHWKIDLTITNEEKVRLDINSTKNLSLLITYETAHERTRNIVKSANCGSISMWNHFSNHTYISSTL